MDRTRIQRAEEVLGLEFANPRLLEIALTHPSYAVEHGHAADYDRLEFLGDAVLGFVVAEYVYSRYPGEPEGDLTRRKHHAVAGDSLSEVAVALGLSGLVMVGVGAHAAGDRERASVMENAMEALVGAIYLDAGMDVARAFVLRALESRLAEIPTPEIDAKGALQQFTQARDRSLPVYHIVSASGPVHQRTFVAEVVVNGEIVGRGEGGSKQTAEKAAAVAALEALGVRE